MNRTSKLVLPAAVAAAGFLGVSGGALLTSLGANAASNTGTSSTSSNSSGTMPSMPAHGSASHEDAETAVTGTNATKAQDAAVKYVGSGTAGGVTTDFTKTGYEVTVTKSDGSTVEVHLDSSFNVMQGGHGTVGGDTGTSSSSTTTN